MAIYYNLGFAAPSHGSCRWPYDVDVSFDDVDCPVGFAEGVGQGVGAITVSAADALSETWRAHFVQTGTLWLLPYLQALAHGVPLPREEILAKFQLIHGRSPELSRFWP